MNNYRSKYSSQELWLTVFQDYCSVNTTEYCKMAPYFQKKYNQDIKPLIKIS